MYDVMISFAGVTSMDGRFFTKEEAEQIAEENRNEGFCSWVEVALVSASDWTEA